MGLHKIIACRYMKSHLRNYEYESKIPEKSHTLEIKKRDVEALTFWCTDLALFLGLHKKETGAGMQNSQCSLAFLCLDIMGYPK